MRDVSLFGEDAGHEVVLKGLLNRLSLDSEVPVRITPLSVTGGVTRVHYELGIFLRDVEKGKLRMPDLIVVATDGNCKGYNARRQEIERVAQPYASLLDLIVYAIPDPHIERWLLADPSAFKTVLGRGCDLPQEKCEKNFYKQVLAKEVRESGVKPILGGLEYADDITANMNLAAAEKNDASLGRVLGELKARFNQWKAQQ